MSSEECSGCGIAALTHRLPCKEEPVFFWAAPPRPERPAPMRHAGDERREHWDGVPVPRGDVDDLDAGALADFRRQAHKSRRLSEEILAESDASLIDKLLLTEGDYLKRAAVLLFHPEPERFVTGARIKIGMFDTDLRYQDEVQGDLFSQVARTIAVLRLKYLKAAISYEGIQRVET